MNDDLMPEEFVRLRQSGELWQLLDVREPWEIELASVPDALCIPMGQVPERYLELDPQLPLAVICHSGVRSARVAAYLQATGFMRVANISGGIDCWSQTVDSSISRY